MLFKALRKEVGITQVLLAEKLGVKQSTVAMWETEKSRPRVTDFLKIAKALNVPVERVVECFTSEIQKVE